MEEEQIKNLVKIQNRIEEIRRMIAPSSKIIGGSAVILAVLGYLFTQKNTTNIKIGGVLAGSVIGYFAGKEIVRKKYDSLLKELNILENELQKINGETLTNK